MHLLTLETAQNVGPASYCVDGRITVPAASVLQGLQIAQISSCLYTLETLGPKVGIIYVLVALGMLQGGIAWAFVAEEILLGVGRLFSLTARETCNCDDTQRAALTL